MLIAFTLCIEFWWYYFRYFTIAVQNGGDWLYCRHCSDASYSGKPSQKSIACSEWFHMLLELVSTPLPQNQSSDRGVLHPNYFTQHALKERGHHVLEPYVWFAPFPTAILMLVLAWRKHFQSHVLYHKVVSFDALQLLKVYRNYSVRSCTSDP